MTQDATDGRDLGVVALDGGDPRAVLQRPDDHHGRRDDDEQQRDEPPPHPAAPSGRVGVG
ncbi:hypothetical protein [Cellulosimicrobium funkei]